MEFTYKAELIDDPDGGFVVTFPDVPEAITGGNTRAQALVMAEDALAVALLGRIDDGAELPGAVATGRDLVPVSVPAAVAAKLAVIIAWKASGQSKSKLADTLGVNEKEVRRMLDPNHNTSLARLDRAMQALGGRLIVSAEMDMAG